MSGPKERVSDFFTSKERERKAEAGHRSRHRILSSGQIAHLEVLKWQRIIETIGGTKNLPMSRVEPHFCRTEEVPLSQIREAPVTVKISQLCPELSTALST